MIWTQPNQIGPDQNKLDSTKMIWMVQNHFGPIEGQGIILLLSFLGTKSSDLFQFLKAFTNYY
jgi:hypothetical protein